MPRQARIDAPGALHHIIVRGIERSRIFRNDTDRDDFLDRLSALVLETSTQCLAWALIPNHFHLLCRTGDIPLSTLMRRLLTGYAVSFNRRHDRHGHLFQNRYRSILCQEDSYLLELVRYLHLNPLRAKLVMSLEDLDTYRYAGHSALMGTVKQEWQSVPAVLARFGQTVDAARETYRRFVADGMDQGRRPDLVGGGLLRSVGGWTAVKELRRQRVRVMSDERILGDSEFVERALRSAEEQLERRTRLYKAGYDLERLAREAAALFGLTPDEILSRGNDRVRVKARSLFCYWAVRELGHSSTALAAMLQLTQPAVSLSVKRGKRLAGELNLTLEMK
jgi:putative transposase